MGKSGDVMDTLDVAQAIAWQADHAGKSGAPITARIVRAQLALLPSDSATGRRIANWQGLSLADALPLRVAGGIHYLHLSGAQPRLAAIYAGLITDQTTIDALVREAVEQSDHIVLPWLDRPPQTNEAGRSALIMAGLAVLAEQLGPRFALFEIGASAGINTMMGRYHFDLGGARFGPSSSPIYLVPEWRGDAPPAAHVEIVGAKGCDIAPVDLSDADQALRLKSYVWPDAIGRMARVDAAIAMAGADAPELVCMDAADYVARCLAEVQETGTTSVLFHTIMWQYIPEDTQDAIEAAMVKAGAGATRDKPLAWLQFETTRRDIGCELSIRYWPDGESRRVLAAAHPHGAWVEWAG